MGGSFRNLLPVRSLTRKFLLGISLFLIFPTYLWGKAPTFVPARSIALVFSSTVYGEIEPCG